MINSAISVVVGCLFGAGAFFLNFALTIAIIIALTGASAVPFSAKLVELLPPFVSYLLFGYLMFRFTCVRQYDVLWVILSAILAFVVLETWLTEHVFAEYASSDKSLGELLYEWVLPPALLLVGFSMARAMATRKQSRR